MSSLTLNVELVAGTDFGIAVKDAKTLCQQLDLAYVTFSFNGISVSVSQRAKVEEAESWFNLILVGGGNPYPFIVV